MLSVALVTYQKSPKLTHSDSFLIKSLEKNECIPHVVSWDDKSIEWNKFDCVVPRSCWDYHYRVEEFLEWITMLEENKVQVLNPTSIIRWNHKKTYLKDLQQQGIQIIPTIYLSDPIEKDIDMIMNQNNWQKIILKPVIGATAHEVMKIERGQSHILPKGEILIQPFMEEIKEGEYSFIFINGIYSHSVLKRPSKNDFRVQTEYDGSKILVQPDQNFITQAEKVVKTVSSELLFARVDAICIKEKLFLMELELIEPDLFFDLYPPAADRFATALKAQIRYDW